MCTRLRENRKSNFDATNNMPAEQTVAAPRFDSIKFAQLSGDWNPMHVDPLVARRTPYGTTVVHGVHVLLAVLDHVCSAGVHMENIQKVTAEFVTPVRHGDNVAFRSSIDDMVWRISVLNDGRTLQRITLVLSDDRQTASDTRKPVLLIIRLAGGRIE